MTVWLRRYRMELLLFLAFWISFASILHTVPNWNVNTRIGLTMAVVDHGTLSIDAYHDAPFTKTRDKAFFEGRYYTDKSPALSFLAIPFYAVVKPFVADLDRRTRILLARHWCTVWTASLLGALATLLFYHLLQGFGASAGDALFLTLVLFYGTPLGGYTSLFYPYLPATACLLGAYRLALSARESSPNTPLFARSAAMGFLISMSMAFEHVFGLAALALTALIVTTLGPRRSLAGLVLGGLPPAVAIATYYYSLFGELSLPYSHEASARFREGMAVGFMGITRPDLSALYYITVHPYRGLFFFSPVLLLFFAGTPFVLRRRRSQRPDLLCAWLILIAYLLFNSSYYMWWGGSSLGPRHMMAALPFLFLPMAVTMRESKRWRAAVFALGGLSVALHLPAILTNPHVPALYTHDKLTSASISDNLESPRLTQVFPRFARGRVAAVLPRTHRDGFLPLLPLLILWTGVFVAARRWPPASAWATQPRES